MVQTLAQVGHTCAVRVANRAAGMRITGGPAAGGLPRQQGVHMMFCWLGFACSKSVSHSLTTQCHVEGNEVIVCWMSLAYRACPMSCAAWWCLQLWWGRLGRQLMMLRVMGMRTWGHHAHHQVRGRSSNPFGIRVLLLFALPLINMRLNVLYRPCSSSRVRCAVPHCAGRQHTFLPLPHVSTHTPVWTANSHALPRGVCAPH